MSHHPTPPPASGLLFEGSPAYQRVIQNFEMAAEVLNLDPNTAGRLRRPEKILIVSVPVRMDDNSVRVFTGYRVQHNDSMGPYKGGIRYHPEVDVGEVCALAMQMTWKTAVMGLPLGGAKGAVRCEPMRLSYGENQRLTRRYTAEIMPIIGPEIDIPAPDMGTNERTMAWMMDTFSQRSGKFVPEVVTGKPVDVGGSVLRIEATGRGLVYTTLEAAKEINLRIDGATVVLHGFGNVGTHAAAEFVRRGAKVTAVADVSGGYVNPKGIDVKRFIEYAAKNRTLDGVDGAERVSAESVLTFPCDILAPAATGHVITAENAPRIRCKILAEGANGPTMPDADPILASNGVHIIPDIVCNAGGVIVSYFEWVQGGMNFFWTEDEIDTRLQRLLLEGYRRSRQFATERNVTMRTASMCVGISRIDRTMRLRGLYA
jgi:glutamate dehydrogenase (NAD(P)+)